MANRAIIYAIYPNKIQEEQCRKTFGCCRFVHNQMLTIQQERYKNGEKHLSKFQANTYCNQHLKKEYPFLKEVDKFALTHAVYHLEDGYDRFFKHLSRFPRYKSKHKAKKSYTTNFTNRNIAVGDDYVKLPKLGGVKAKIHRKPEEDWKIKSATITQNRDGTYQVSILFEYIADTVSALAVTEDTAVGLDYKSDGLYTDSNGETCGMPHYYRDSAKRLAKAQRKLKHKTVGSNNYKKQQKRIARLHRHVANQRKDFLQKRSTAIAKRYDKYPYGKPQTDEVARGSGNREYGCRRLREKLPNFSGVSFFRAGNSNSLTNAFHICVYVHLCVVPRYIASQHPWKQSQSLLQNTKETTAGHFRRSVFLLSGRIPGVHELLWKAASLSCGRYR